MFFVDSLNYTNEEKTKEELERFNNFVISKTAMKTTQAEVPNVFYEKVIPERRENYRHKENIISDDQMKRTEFFANQSRNKLVDYDGNSAIPIGKTIKNGKLLKIKLLRWKMQMQCWLKQRNPLFTKQEIYVKDLWEFA